jgi:hypothetical protein
MNRIILDIWLTSFSRFLTSKSSSTYQVNSSEILKALQTLTTLFLFSFYASSRFTWFQSHRFPTLSTDAKDHTTDRPTLTLFIENLVKIFKVLLENDLGEERKSIEALIHIIFDKLGIEVPLEAIIKESKHLQRMVGKDPWTSLLEERLCNIIVQEESMLI